MSRIADDRPTDNSLHPQHAQELIEASGIDPAVVARRGYRSVTAAEAAALGFAPYQARAGLLMPQWTLAGVQVGYLLKPNEPRVIDGKPRKYEAPDGSVPHFDVHPDARPLLRDSSVPLYLTEGNKKADAAWSRGLLTVSLTGVYMFLHGRLVVADFDEITLAGRVVRVAFDSDVTRKRSVADAQFRLCEALRRRGAIVEIIAFPEGPDGAKVGFDDWFAQGHDVSDLDALAHPWDGHGPGIWLRQSGDADPDELAAVNAALVQAILNPENTRADLMIMASVAGQVRRKAAAGEAEPDGRVVLSAAEIADDWRPAPERGAHVASVNPNGTKPRMARAAVKKAVTAAVATGRLRASPRRVRRAHANGNAYLDTEWLVDPGPSLAALLNPWATYHPTEPKLRKPRTAPPPCPECGEVHPIHQRDYCAGCGALLTERVIAPIVAEAGTSEKLSEVNTGPPPAPFRSVGTIFRGAGSPTPEEPAWLAASFADGEWVADTGSERSQSTRGQAPADREAAVGAASAAARGGDGRVRRRDGR